MSIKEAFPILGMKEFGPEPGPDYHLQYHELRGFRHIDKPHRHDFFVFLLFEKGSGTHSIDFTDYKVAGSEIHLLFPGQVHKWELGKDTRAYQLMISRKIFESFSGSLDFSLEFYQHHPVVHLSPRTFRGLLYEFRAIRDELRLESRHREIINLRTRLIAQLVGREAESQSEDIRLFRAKPVLLKYYSLVDIHFREQKLVSFYADKLNISANYLNILCRRHLHMAALSVIQNRVTLEAKRLIHVSEKSIKEIAFELGFNDTAYFSNFFKRKTGVGPKQFRDGA